MSTAEIASEKPQRRLSMPRLGKGGELLPLAVALIVTIIGFRVASEFFLTARNLTNLLDQLAPGGRILEYDHGRLREQ